MCIHGVEQCSFTKRLWRRIESLFLPLLQFNSTSFEKRWDLKASAAAVNSTSFEKQWVMARSQNWKSVYILPFSFSQNIHSWFFLSFSSKCDFHWELDITYFWWFIGTAKYYMPCICMNLVIADLIWLFKEKLIKPYLAWSEGTLEGRSAVSQLPWPEQ